MQREWGGDSNSRTALLVAVLVEVGVQREAD